MLVIGSTAIKHWFPDFNREPKDIDYVVREYKQSTREVEYLVNPVLLDYVADLAYINVIGKPRYATPNVLLTLKVSHIFWDINWDKHMWDIQFLLLKGCKIIPELFDKLYTYWNDYHGKNKRSKLDMSSEEFFDNAITCPYDHDWLHTLIKDPPTYTKVLIGEVEVSEELFNQLTFEEKCNLVREEIYIMSWERKFHKDYRISYARMLRKFIRNHAPMWEALFIIENYNLLSKPEFNYFQKIENGIEQNQ